MHRQKVRSANSAGATGLARRSLRRSSRAPAIDKDSDIESMEVKIAQVQNDRETAFPGFLRARARDQDADVEDSDDGCCQQQSQGRTSNIARRYHNSVSKATRTLRLV
jgi:hypothetical protein